MRSPTLIKESASIAVCSLFVFAYASPYRSVR